MNTRIEQQIDELTPKYVNGLPIYMITVVTIILGAAISAGFFILAVIFGIFTVLIVVNTRKELTAMAKLKTDYQYNKADALDVVYERIKRVENRVMVNERKASRPGKDRRDSAKDAERARQELTKWMALKDMIIKLHNNNDEDPFAV